MNAVESSMVQLMMHKKRILTLKGAEQDKREPKKENNHREREVVRCRGGYHQSHQKKNLGES